VRRRFHATLLVVLLSLPGAAASAAELEVAVVGVDGAPVADAVVMLRSPAATAAPKTAAPRGGAETATVDQSHKQFSPWLQAVRVGTQVKFANHDDITHHVYSFSPAKRFSYRLQTGAVEGPLAFDAPGVVVLGCNIHDWMVGYVYVTDAPRFLVTDAQGKARFSELAAGAWQVQLWHPGLTANGAPPDRQVALAADDRLEISLKLEAKLRETGPRRPLAGADY
jgi:plastocyanin